MATEKKNFEDLTARELLREYVGNITCSCRGGSYSEGSVMAGVLTLAGMVKEARLENKLLKEKVTFLERIVNQVFTKVEEK